MTTTAPIRTEADLAEAWRTWECLANQLHEAVLAQVPSFESFEPRDQGRILASFHDHPDHRQLSDLLSATITAAERLDGHGRPSPLPMGSDEPLAETLEATTGLPFVVTTNGWRDTMHRELAAQGHGTLDPDTNRFEAPRDPEDYHRMMVALEALLRPEAVR